MMTIDNLNKIHTILVYFIWIDNSKHFRGDTDLMSACNDWTWFANLSKIEILSYSFNNTIH